jgi:hypothetical protein
MRRMTAVHRSTIRRAVLGLAIGAMTAAVAQASPGYELRYYPSQS